MPSDLKVYIAQTDVISFDVFDTLFVRPLHDPEDLFDIVGEKFGITEFRRLRREAQAQAFRRMHEREQKEITLQGIYECFGSLPVPVEALRQAEYELELALTIPNPELISLFCRSVLDKQVVITSDMYLPREFFVELFQRYGLPEVPMFISSDRNATKRDRGELFDIVAAALGVSPREILHVGDNQFSDIQQAKAKGLKTFHYRNTRKPVPIQSSSTSASIASSVIRIVEPAPQSNSFHELGFMYGGPAAVGFLNWIKQESVKDQIDLILFVSRDGYVLERLAKRDETGTFPRFSYFKGSRVSFSLAATDETNFERQIDFLIAGSQELAPVEVLERIGVPPPADHVMEDLGLGNDVVIGPEIEDRLRSFLYAYRWEILKVCRRNRQGLFQYLIDLGIVPGMRIAMVDVGWNGTTQDAFQAALNKLIDVDLIGYYLCLTDLPDCLRRRQTLNMKALITSNSVSPDIVQQVYANRVAIELFFSAPHYPVIGYQRMENGSLQVIEDPGRTSKHNLCHVCNELIHGMEEFSEYFAQVCRSIGHSPKPLETVAPLLSFVTSINESTLNLLSSVRNFDAWASSRNRDMALSDYISTVSLEQLSGEQAQKAFAASASTAT
jgi:predicted HAD superfamily hydrolase